jgi:hypothetical protein
VDESDSQPVSHDPKDGKQDITHTETPWTQAYIWNAEQWKWVLGNKVNGKPVVTTVTTDSEACAAVVPTPTPTTSTPATPTTPAPTASATSTAVVGLAQTGMDVRAWLIVIGGLFALGILALGVSARKTNKQ